VISNLEKEKARYKSIGWKEEFDFL